MSEVTGHLLLFLVVAFAIVLLGTFHTEASDEGAFRALPRRAFTFLVGCAILAGIVLAV